MKHSNHLQEACQDIIDNCIGCNQCIDRCQLLQQIDEEIVNIAQRQPSVDEAYACSLCGLCEAVCPCSLSVKNMFAETRKKAVEEESIAINEYRYMFPDRKWNVASLYRELNDILYQDMCVNQECPVAFFPGCTMLTYSEELTRALYSQLKNKYKDITLITDCCGMPLSQLGLQTRCDDYVQKVIANLQTLKIKEIVIACPNCYYQLRPILKEKGINLVTTYEALADSDRLNMPIEKTKNHQVTIHDSCPDRFDGIFAKQTRKALLRKGYQIVEMDRNQDETVCCGSGGEVSHFRPDLSDQLVKSRVAEAESTGAKILATSCLACALNFSKVPSEMKVRHALNLLLDLEQNFSGVKAKSKKMFEGEHGERNWNQIMAEE